MLYCYDLLQKGYKVSSLVPIYYFVIRQQEHRVEETSLLTFLPNVKHEQVGVLEGEKCSMASTSTVAQLEASG